MIGKHSVMLNSKEKRVIDQIAERGQDLCESSPFLVPNTLRKRLHGGAGHPRWLGREGEASGKFGLPAGATIGLLAPFSLTQSV